MQWLLFSSDLRFLSTTLAATEMNLTDASLVRNDHTVLNYIDVDMNGFWSMYVEVTASFLLCRSRRIR
jgi:hypothetical protein